MKRHILTPEQLEFLKNNVEGLHNKKLTEIFNTNFGTNLSWEAIRSFKKYYHLRSGIDPKLKPGNNLWKHVKNHKGKVCSTSYKKGHIPIIQKPIGSERIDSEGYIWVKVAQPRKWREKSQVLWEQTNGSIPKGSIVIFGDGNKQNLELFNLILVTRRQLIKLNQNNLIQSNADLTRSGILIADILNKIGEKTREKYTRRSK